MVEIYKVLLNVAFDLDILHYEESKKKVQVDGNVLSKTQACYIKTNDGNIKISVNFTEVRLPNSHLQGLYTATFINNLKSFSDEDIQELILDQLDTEVFLYHDDSEDIQCICESF